MCSYQLFCVYGLHVELCNSKWNCNPELQMSSTQHWKPLPSHFNFNPDSRSYATSAYVTSTKLVIVKYNWNSENMLEAPALGPHKGMRIKTLVKTHLDCIWDCLKTNKAKFKYLSGRAFWPGTQKIQSISPHPPTSTPRPPPPTPGGKLSPQKLWSRTTSSWSKLVFFWCFLLQI